MAKAAADAAHGMESGEDELDAGGVDFKRSLWAYTLSTIAAVNGNAIAILPAFIPV